MEFVLAQTMLHCVLLLSFFFFFFFFFWGTCLLLLLLFFFFLTNPFVQDLKLSDLLPIFVLLRVLSFLIDLIITSYRCISQNSPEKLKQKETVWTSKTDLGSQNRTVRMGPYFFPIEQFLKLKKLQNWEVHDFSGRTVQSGPGFKTSLMKWPSYQGCAVISTNWFGLVCSFLSFSKMRSIHI